ELTVILQDGMRRMLDAQEDVFYYVTTMNENYAQPPLPAEAEEGIKRGMYLLRASAMEGERPRVALAGAGTILREALAAAEQLERDQHIAADVYSVTSFTELRRDGLACDAWNRDHPDARRKSWVEQCFARNAGPVIAASDYVRAVADLIRTWVPGQYVTLGTDGYGRSDTRANLRAYFGVDRDTICATAVAALRDARR
ncbi:MAG: pyruvate dehydrogenase, partial [Casimicrobiaceae bacterium]